MLKEFSSSYKLTPAPENAFRFQSNYDNGSNFKPEKDSFYTSKAEQLRKCKKSLFSQQKLEQMFQFFKSNLNAKIWKKT